MTDTGLGKLVPPLLRLGKQVPALARLAEAIGQVAGELTETVSRLLDLAVMVRQVRSVLATAADCSGRLVPLPASGPWQTGLSGSEADRLARRLGRPGREAWKDLAQEVQRQGSLDLRLLAPAAERIADFHGRGCRQSECPPPPDWAGPVAEELEKVLNLQGDDTDVRRLDLLVHLAPERAWPLCRAALAQGSNPVAHVALISLHSAPDVTACLPDLLRQFDNPSVPHWEAAALIGRRIGPPALPDLLPLLDGDSSRRYGAIVAINEMLDGPRADEVRPALLPQVPRLLASLANVPDQFVLKQKLDLLTELTSGEDVVGKRLVEILRQQNESDQRLGLPPQQEEPGYGMDRPADLCRGNMLSYLGKHGIPDESALDVIATRAGLERERYPYQLVIHCLANLAEAHPSALTRLLNLFGRRGRDGCLAAQQLGQKRELAAPLVPQLTALAGGQNRNLRLSALEALFYLGDLAASALPVILAATTDPDSAVRLRAIRAVRTVEADQTRAVSLLAAALDDPDEQVRLQVLEQLWALGYVGQASGVVEALHRGLQDPVLRLRRQALRWLTGIRGLTVERLPILLEAVRHPEEEMRLEVVEGLGQFGKHATEVLPALGTALSDQSPDVRRAAAASLGRLRPATAALVRALRPALKDKEAEVRRQAAAALGQLGALSAPALPALRRLAEKYPREKAYRKAIQRIGP